MIVHRLMGLFVSASLLEMRVSLLEWRARMDAEWLKVDWVGYPLFYLNSWSIFCSLVLFYAPENWLLWIIIPRHHSSLDLANGIHLQNFGGREKTFFFSVPSLTWAVFYWQWLPVSILAVIGQNFSSYRRSLFHGPSSHQEVPHAWRTNTKNIPIKIRKKTRMSIFPQLFNIVLEVLLNAIIGEGNTILILERRRQDDHYCKWNESKRINQWKTILN